MMRKKPSFRFVALLLCLIGIFSLALQLQGCGYDGSPAGTIVSDDPSDSTGDTSGTDTGSES